jgi:hypothetical protein
VKATTYVTLLLWACVAWGQGNLEVIPLRHATVEQVLPVLQPLLAPGGVLTGQRNQLIVRTSPANLAEIRRALEAIDVPARRLVISVRHEDSADASLGSAAVGGAVSSRGAVISGSAVDTRSLSDSRVDQRVQVLEGGHAAIGEGGTRPLQTRDGVVFQDIRTGFDVVPRLSGDEVTLEVSPQRQRPGAAPGQVEGISSTTTIRARLGQWVELGGTARSARSEERGISARTRRDDEGARRIWIRVDEARP